MKDLYNVIKGPVLTEKSALFQESADSGSRVVLKVDPRANKIEIKNAVEKLFDVKVGSIKTASMPGKKKRMGLKSVGRTSDWKKAYVTLSEGEINLLEEL